MDQLAEAILPVGLAAWVFVSRWRHALPPVSPESGLLPPSEVVAHASSAS